MRLVRNFLTSTQTSFYASNGYLVLPNFIPLPELTAAKSRIFNHIESFNPSEFQTFATGKEKPDLSNAYFLQSAYNIRFFFEAGVSFPVANKHTSINKIGHALHDIDDFFIKFSYRPEYRRLLADLNYVKPQIVQSQYIIKGPKIGGRVTQHQDSSYLISEPRSCIGIWVALEDADPTNACMYAVPGSHKGGTKTLWEYSDGKLAYSNPYEYSTDGAVCLEAKAGTVILLHGDLVHWSEQNYSDKSRHAYTIHIVEGLHKWSEKNWIRRPDFFPFRDWEL